MVITVYACGFVPHLMLHAYNRMKAWGPHIYLFDRMTSVILCLNKASLETYKALPHVPHYGIPWSSFCVYYWRLRMTYYLTVVLCKAPSMLKPFFHPIFIDTNCIRHHRTSVLKCDHVLAKHARSLPLRTRLCTAVLTNFYQLQFREWHGSNEKKTDRKATL